MNHKFDIICDFPQGIIEFEYGKTTEYEHVTNDKYNEPKYLCREVISLIKDR
jgi:hypothetical protein